MQTGVRCGATQESGLLFCEVCAPPYVVDADTGQVLEMMTQSVTIYVGWGDMSVAKARHGDKGKVKPHVVASRGHKWMTDRGRREVRVLLQDHEADRWLEVWYDEETGEETWSVEGRLSDQGVHGASTQRHQTERTAGGRREPDSGDSVGLSDPPPAVTLTRGADDAP